MNTGHGTKNPSVRGALPFAPEVYQAVEGEQANPVDVLRTELRNEVRALRTLVARSGTPEDLAVELAAIRSALDELAPAYGKKDSLAAWLRARRIEGAVATRVAAVARSCEGDVTSRIRAAIPKVIGLTPWEDDHRDRRIVAVIGPSGVGKTTTAAKIATRARLLGKSVALVSCDGFRVGALDQLERYAELLEAAFRFAPNGVELAAILEDAKEDLVIVDTSGRPPGPASPEVQLVSRARKEAIEVILCMAACTRASDANAIAATFAPARPTMVAVTKIDETRSPSALLHAPFAAKRPLAIMCAGPRVPEDIAPASLDGLLAQVDQSAQHKEEAR